MNKLLIFIISILLYVGILSLKETDRQVSVKSEIEKPKIAFTFDDGRTDDIVGYKLQVWNELLLSKLKNHQIKAILFSSGSNKTTERGRYILSSWNDAGHLIANHTFTHPNFNNKNISLETFKAELTKNDSIIRNYSNYYPYFRFPYLKEGNTKEKIEGFRAFMKQKGYKNGYVTIDASDWYISNRLVNRLKQNSKAEISGFKAYYKKHLYSRAVFYDSLAYQMFDRKINHIILLHHNLAAALFLDDLINHFKLNGWEIISADKAYQDKIYDELPVNVPAGESLIWALAKQSGKFEKVLRYPAEDSEYEKPIMDKLGL